ncbi:MAG: CCA tRNA nucleotidyltransferase [Lentisphaeria bacterium]|nr:CCA tRNA nucleotidyltransferase [Lentisphaeria bacterium]
MRIKEYIPEAITEIITRLQNAGKEAYIVGGAVRDILLDRNPKDFDISTSATPEEIRKIFRDKHTIIIGKRFRLVHLYLKNDIVEISTFRKQPCAQQALHKPGRETPENMIVQDNEFGTAQEDAYRRDFTVNALFYDPVHDKIEDFTGLGVNDIKAGCIRAIGDPALRFEEDPVRILRAIKLAGLYGFKPETQKQEAIHSCMDLIDHASNSRLTLELEKILKNPYGHRILKAFREYGFLRKFLPYLDARWETPQCTYMLALLEERNRRMRSGLYRDSISLAISICTLPFAEQLIGGHTEPGSLWQFDSNLQDRLWDLAHAVLGPATLTRRAAGAAVRTLLLQERLKSLLLKKLTSHPGYPHGRELAIIQNNVLWNMENFEESLPPPTGKAKRPRHPGYFRGGKSNKIQLPADTESGNGFNEETVQEKEEFQS